MTCVVKCKLNTCNRLLDEEGSNSLVLQDAGFAIQKLQV